jgi:hypothetical protein
MARKQAEIEFFPNVPRFKMLAAKPKRMSRPEKKLRGDGL